jgi:hypothetical protein
MTTHPSITSDNICHIKSLRAAAGQLSNRWLLDTELLLRKLEQCRELVMQIPISNPAATQDGIKIALNAVCTLQNDLRFLLHLHREGQRAFAKQSSEAECALQTKTPAHAPSKVVRMKA